MQSKHLSTWFLKTLGRITILVSILLLNIRVPLPTTQAADPIPEFSIFLPVVTNGTPSMSLPPTAQQLIAADLTAGRIDANTALLYRAYAEYGDPRLPDKYGGGYLMDDPLFFTFIEDLNLPAEMKAQLEPFLVRPDDSKSVYNATPGINAPVTSGQAGDLSCDPYGWMAQDGVSAQYNFRVHAKCSGAYTEDILTTIQFMTELWEPMTNLMGWPILDDGEGGTIGIDIYLLMPLDNLKRYKEEKNPLAPGTLGFARPAPPRMGYKSSSYIVVDRQRVNDGDNYKSLLAHEFFHSLQFAHNQKVTVVKGEVWWFTEASATWADVHFVPAVSAVEHQRFTYTFQALFASLHTRSTVDLAHIYSAYIWPFFMEQEVTDESISQVWQGLETVGTDWIEAMGVLDQVLPFSGNFRRFALRNLNVTLEPGNPVQPRYIAIDPQFPDKILPSNRIDLADVKTPFSAADLDLPALSAKYYHFTFNAEILSVKLDLSKMSTLDRVAVEALVKERGKPWEHRSLTGRSNVELCNVEELFLIFSNERIGLDDFVKINFTMSPLTEACTHACQQVVDVGKWDGEVTVSYAIDMKNSEYDILENSQTSVSGRLIETYRNPSAIGFMAAAPFGNGNYHSRRVRIYPDGQTYLEGDIVGNGPPLPFDPMTLTGSRIMLSFDLIECTYSLYVGVWISGTYTSEFDPPSPLNVGIVQAASGDVAIPDSPLSGFYDSASWPAHSSDYIMTQTTNISYIVQDDYDLFRFLGEGNLGIAKASWSFTPVIGP